MVEKQAVGAVADFLSKLDKDTLTASQLDNRMQFHEEQGFKALEQKLEDALQNIPPEQPEETLIRTIDNAKSRLIQLLREEFHSAGWAQPPRAESNLKWESSEGPLLLKRGLSLQQLKLDKADSASGKFASVSIFENENGDKLVGKISKNKIPDGKGGIADDLAAELKAYQTIYEAVGPHPNLVNVYGIAQVPNENGEMTRAMLMDAVPGPIGEEAFAALRESWDADKISSAEYWGAIQFIGRRLLDVTEHISKAGVVHNDIKPANFLVNEKTGEPVLIDLGFSTEKDKKPIGATKHYMAPEVRDGQAVDERSDVFTVGASLVRGIEGREEAAGIEKAAKRQPNEGLFKHDYFKDRDGNVLRKKASYSTETAYTRFMNSVMEGNKDIRVNSQEAKNLPFLNDSMLDEDAAKEVIKKALALPPMDHVSQERVEDTASLLEAFTQTPDLAAYARLRNASKTDPGLKKILDSGVLDYLRDDVEQDAARHAEKFITKASWFKDVKRISEAVPKTAIKSGVDENGIRLKNTGQNRDPNYERSVSKARLDSIFYAKVDDLRLYAHEAEAFLNDAGTLKSEISKSKIEEQTQQVRERVVVARRMVEIFDTDLSSSRKPENGNVRDHVAKSERQLRRRK